LTVQPDSPPRRAACRFNRPRHSVRGFATVRPFFIVTLVGAGKQFIEEFEGVW
jgi:hypothetical protein